MTERIWFYILSLGIGLAAAAIFVWIELTGVVYVYETIAPVLWLEIVVSAGYVLWTLRLLAIEITKK